ncbi:PREDICTED: nucleoside diphosphate kinase homolog 5 isoform X4 [Sturnus vulgaris]|uniref:nucleoside diphosphate kinase homolog 5 isoform X4 n=1 Tax=Sturnus vulgaris TaxID=9172 RepID=UPI000719EF6F|nr:PREDICTED: nucleoside diphosphate kinase homolog 5 isoform X4 [Sturnus vulgaris]
MSCADVFAVRKEQVNSNLEARMEVLMPEPQIYVERTLAIIKPDIIDKEEEIEDLILRSGFHIIQKRNLQLSPEQCSNFYAEQFGKMFFPNLTAYMSSGPIVAMVLARNCAVSYWKELLGPSNSVRARITHPHSNLGANSHWTKSSGLPEPVCEAHAARRAHCPVQREASRPHGMCRVPALLAALGCSYLLVIMSLFIGELLCW